jgi:hypothetical protein
MKIIDAFEIAKNFSNSNMKDLRDPIMLSYGINDIPRQSLPKVIKKMSKKKDTDSEVATSKLKWRRGF